MLIVQEHFIHTNNWPYRIIPAGKYFVRVYRFILCRKVTFEGAKYNYMQTFNAGRGVGWAYQHAKFLDPFFPHFFFVAML